MTTPPRPARHIAVAVVIEANFDPLVQLISTITTRAEIDEVFVAILWTQMDQAPPETDLAANLEYAISTALTPNLDPVGQPGTLALHTVSMAHFDAHAIGVALASHLLALDGVTWTLSCVDDPISQMITAEFVSLIADHCDDDVATLTQVTEYYSGRVRLLRGDLSYEWDQDRSAVLLWQLPTRRHRDLVDTSVRPISLQHPEVVTDRSNSIHLSIQTGSDAGSLHNASIVIALGAGASSSRAVLAAQSLAEKLNGVLGATRVLTDRGILPHELQIGTTGVTIAPTVYLSFGVSGALQHLQGIVMPEQSITVNTDPDATMVKTSAIAYIADAESVLTDLVAVLESPNDAGRADS